MSITTAIAIYFVIWWVALFVVLPWGIRSQHESSDDISPGTDPGAPVAARLWLRLLWTTIVATVIFIVCVIIYDFRLVTLEGLAALFGAPR